MCTADKVHIVFLEEAGDDVGAEGEGDASVVLTPACDVLIGIRPEKIAEQTAIRNISWPHDATNLLHGVEVRAQSSVHREDLLVDDGSDWQAVEAVGESLPQLDIVSALALIVEAVDAVDRGAFVVTAKNEEIFRVLDLVGE